MGNGIIQLRMSKKIKIGTSYLKKAQLKNERENYNKHGYTSHKTSFVTIPGMFNSVL